MTEEYVWTAEPWKTPDLLVVIDNGDEKKEEYISRPSIRDFTILDIVIDRLPLLVNDLRRKINVEVDGKPVLPSEAEQISAFTAVKILIYLSKEDSTKENEVKTPQHDARKYHTHQGIIGSHKITDIHREPEAGRYHINEKIEHIKETT